MFKYLRKKMIFYLITFFIAMTINWIVPRLMPGDPINIMVSKFRGNSDSKENFKNFIRERYNLNKPLWKQYLLFWKDLSRGEFGTSLYYRPKKSLDVILEAIPYSLVIVIPAIFLSWFLGNWLGAIASQKKSLGEKVLSFMYILTATPYMWMGFILTWILSYNLDLFPLGFAYDKGIMPGFNLEFILNFLWHWTLPFFTLMIVWIGGWAIGMRNLIVYELKEDYANYLESLGASKKLIRKYAYKNAILPQVTGLGIQFGLLMAGNIVIEIVFSYPGVGLRILQAVKSQDYFVMQAGFTFLILGVLIGNFLVDILYIFVDPRIRYQYQESV